VKGDKALVFDLVFGGKDAPPHLAATMFSALPAGGGKSTKVEGLGERRFFITIKPALR
jgi:hypothetical protein